MTMPKQDIESRQEIALLVHNFYARVREEEVLGPIFNSVIHDWDTHLEKLTDFWEGNLFFFVKSKFQGDPKTAHQRVDELLGHTIEMEHFGRWMNLWIETIDELFEGETAQRAKNIARKMATFLYLKIFEKRPKAAP